MRTVRTIGCGLLILAGGAGHARAQEGGAINFIELFQQLDANGDFVIEKGEVPESGRPAFEKLLKDADANKDGKIDREEYRDMLQGLRGAAQGAVPDGPARFKAMDKDGDGKLSKDEFPGPPPLFDRVDANQDGFIDLAEAGRFRAAAGAVPARLKAMDKDGDGKVSKDEFTGPAPLFERLDANKDGFVTLAEAAQLGGGGGAAGGGQAPRLRAMDKNGDGKISKDEFTGPAPLFERLDADKDGFVTLAEAARSGLGGGGAGGAPQAGRFRAMDKDGDGKVSKDEFTGPAPLFERLDADKDGFVTLAEAAQLGGGGGGGAGTAQAPFFRAMDKNGDGKIGRDEFLGRPMVFDRLDADQDGFLSLEEFRNNRPGNGAAKGAARKTARPKDATK